MFKGLASRVLRAVSGRSGRSGLPNNPTGARDARCQAAPPSLVGGVGRLDGARVRDSAQLGYLSPQHTRPPSHNFHQNDTALGLKSQDLCHPDVVDPERLVNGITRFMELLSAQDASNTGQAKTADPRTPSRSTEQIVPNVSAHIEAIRATTGYVFKDPELVRGAIFKSGSTFKGKPARRTIQLILARIGDKYLEMEDLTQNFGYGDYTRNGKFLSMNATLHYCAQELGLPKMLAESGHATRIQGDSSKGFGTMVEAIIGAIYMDSGRDGEVTNAAMKRLLGTSLKSHEAEEWMAHNAARVDLPKPKLYWEDLVKAQLRLKREEQENMWPSALKAPKEVPITSDVNLVAPEDPLMRNLRKWAMGADSPRHVRREVRREARKGALARLKRRSIRHHDLGGAATRKAMAIKKLKLQQAIWESRLANSSPNEPDARKAQFKLERIWTHLASFEGG